MKLIVNAYMSILIEGVAETMALADRFGVGHQQLAECIAGARWTRRSPTPSCKDGPRRLWCGVPAGVGAEGRGPGDRRLGGEAPPLLAALSAQWHAAVAAGHGRQDISAARLALDSRTG